MNLNSKIFLLLIFVSFQSFGSDVSFTHSQSDSSSGNSVSISGKVINDLKMGISAGSTKDTSGVTDDNSSYFKIYSKFKIDSEKSIQLDYKKSDESYFFEGQSITGKYILKFQDFDSSELNLAMNNKVYLKVELGKKSYSLDTTESLSYRKISASYDRDFQNGISSGFDISSTSYIGTGTEIKNYLNTQTTSNSDVSSYLDLLAKSSFSAFIEKIFSDTFTLGFSFSRDLPLLTSGTQSDGAEIYIDYQIIEDLSINVSLTKSAINTSSPTAATSLGLLYSF